MDAGCLYSGSVGLVARGSRYIIITSAWEFLPSHGSVEEDELQACVMGLLIGLDICTHLTLETNCLYVLRYLVTAQFEKYAIIDLKKEAKEILVRLQDVTICKISRETNVV